MANSATILPLLLYFEVGHGLDTERPIRQLSRLLPVG